MVRGRSGFGLTKNNEKLFAVGGYHKKDQWRYMNTMETISILGGQWSEEELPFSVVGACVVSINDTIAVIGGKGPNVSEHFELSIK